MDGIIQHIKLLCFLVMILIFSGCANVMEKPEITENSTQVYSLKDGNKVVDSISFCRKVDRENGELIGEGNEFIIMNEGRVQAIVSLSDFIQNSNKPSMFHFDWISASGYTTYLRQVDYIPNDSVDFIRSSISLNPDIRSPGEYKLRIYYFREMIAEKNFILLPEFDPSTYNLQSFSEDLVFCKKLDKKTGEPLGIDSVFNQSQKGSIRATFKLDKEISIAQQEQLYRFDWFLKGDTTTLYRKHVDVLPADSLNNISSSLSIATDKRQPGEYFVVLNLFGKPIAQKEFVLLPPVDYSAIKVKTTLYRKKSKKTGKLIGVGSQFVIGEKKKVRAIVNISGLDEFVGKELEFKLRWVGPGGKGVYSKSYTVISEISTLALKNAISITPGKRKSGEYTLQVYLAGELLGEKKFELHSK